MTAFHSTVAIERRRETIRRYLARRQLYPFQVSAEPSPDLGLAVVIPCFDEPDVRRTLDSLAECDPPGCDVEILVVINAPEGSDQSVVENNARALAQVMDSADQTALDWLRFHGLQHIELPASDAGVGLARKIGMDEAAGRIGQTFDCDGVIISLDADCRVARNFLVEVRDEFCAHHDCPGVSIYFEHPLKKNGGPMIEAMQLYELHLRYYVAGQRWARFPYAFHTIGSAMACRASIYAGQGGMNRRRGGEDFYFIQKLIALGGYRALTGTTVYPDSRTSDRVPFGTGTALRNALGRQVPMDTFAPAVFRDLKCFCRAIMETEPAAARDAVRGLPLPIRRFLENCEFSSRLREIERNIASRSAFRKRVFRWFNAFRFLKFAQYSSRHFYPRIPVAEAAGQLARSAGLIESPEGLDPASMLSHYRQLDRQPATHELIKDLF